MPESNLTKRALASAMKRLMEDHPFEKVGVSDICDACGVSRKTFYYHFQDKYQLAEWIFNTEFIGMLQQTKLSDRWAFATAVCQYFYREKEFYAALLRYDGQNSFRKYFQSFLFESLEKIILPEDTKLMAMAHQDGVRLDEVRDFCSQFLSDALLVSILRWLTEGARMPPEQFVARLKGVSDILLIRAEELLEEF